MEVGQRRLPPTSLAKFGVIGGLGGAAVGTVEGIVDKNTNPHADFDTVSNHALQGGLYGLLGGLGIGSVYKAFDPFTNSTLKQSLFTNSEGSITAGLNSGANLAQKLVTGGF